MKVEFKNKEGDSLALANEFTVIPVFLWDLESVLGNESSMLHILKKFHVTGGAWELVRTAESKWLFARENHGACRYFLVER